MDKTTTASKIGEGWRCPECGSIYAPQITECSKCKFDKILRKLNTKGLLVAEGIMIGLAASKEFTR